MKKIILNEKAYAEKILKTGNIGNNPRYALTILASYYYCCLGYRKLKITELLIAFLEKNYPEYTKNKSSWAETCEKIAKKTGKAICEKTGITITEGEVAKIKSLNNLQYERLLFTILVLCKISNAKNANNLWCNTNFVDLFNLACVKATKADRELVLHTLINSGLIENTKDSAKLNLKVTFAENDGKAAMTITDFRNIGLQYEQKYYQTRLFVCPQCGIIHRQIKDAGKNNINLINYCYDCLQKAKTKTRTVKCADCGKIFTVNANATKVNRCSACAH